MKTSKNSGSLPRSHGGSLTVDVPGGKKIRPKQIKPAVQEICGLHDQITSATRKSVEQAIRVGELLWNLKAEVGFGNWGAFIKEHLPFSERTAQNYLALYKNRRTLKSENVADLLLSEAYAAISNPKKPGTNDGGNQDDSPSLLVLPTPPESLGADQVQGGGEIGRKEKEQTADLASVSPAPQSVAHRDDPSADDRLAKRQLISEIQVSMAKMLRHLTRGPESQLATFKTAFESFLSSWETTDSRHHHQEAA
jgi:hypothetical protein